MEKEKKKPVNGAQICKIQNAKKLIEFCDSLKPAGMNSYAKLHAEAEEDPGGNGKLYSRIRLNLVDYANGTGDSLRHAEFNLSASEVRRLLWESKREILRWDIQQTIFPIAAGVEQVAERENKILTCINYIKQVFGTKESLQQATAPVKVCAGYKPWELHIDKIISSKRNEDGSSPMSRLAITRTPVAADGKPMLSPWKITVDNGTAVAKQNQNGGSYAERGTFKSGNGGVLSFNASDEDWITALEKTVAFIDCFEKAYCCSVIRKARSVGTLATTAQNIDTVAANLIPASELKRPEASNEKTESQEKSENRQTQAAAPAFPAAPIQTIL